MDSRVSTPACGARLPASSAVARRYIVCVDARLEGHAVPLVDEIAAIPLDIAAAERGFTKVTPNLMGF